MTEEDILSAAGDYAAAVKNAIAAGFDGLEIQEVNGYSLDQFPQTTCNKYSDNCGGSIENRARFHLEVTKAVVAAVGADRTGVRLSPYSDFNGMLMDDLESLFEYPSPQLKPLGLIYLHLIEACIKGNDDADCGGQKSVAWTSKCGTTPALLCWPGASSRSRHDIGLTRLKKATILSLRG
jgi:NADPH2 dehydrogenase